MHNIYTTVLLPNTNSITYSEIKKGFIDVYIKHTDRPLFVNHLFLRFKEYDYELLQKLKKRIKIIDEFKNEFGWYIIIERTYLINYLIRTIRLHQYNCLGKQLKQKIHKFWNENDESEFYKLL